MQKGYVPTQQQRADHLLIAEMVDPGSRVLDVGCGDGALLQLLAHTKAVDGRGIVRIDFLVKPDSGEVFLNELNTMPGSLAFYLWKATGVSSSQLVDKLVELARDAYADKRRNMYDYKTNLVAVAAGRGLKGAKGLKSNPN